MGLTNIALLFLNCGPFGLDKEGPLEANVAIAGI
jgi:hypothetical protein